MWEVNRVASEAFVNESLMGCSGVTATAFFVAGAGNFFTVGAFAFFSTGVTAFFGAGFAAAFVALVVAVDSSLPVKGGPRPLPSHGHRQYAKVQILRLALAYGTWQCHGEVRHLVAQMLVDMSHLRGGLITASRNFC